MSFHWKKQKNHRFGYSSCGALFNHIKAKGVLPLTAGGNKSGQQLRKRAVASSAFVSHHQADELSPCSSPSKPEHSAECSGCHPAERSDTGNPAEAHRAAQVFNGKHTRKCVAGLRPKGLAPCSLQLLGSQGQYCHIPCGRQFLRPWGHWWSLRYGEVICKMSSAVVLF